MQHIEKITTIYGFLIYLNYLNDTDSDRSWSTKELKEDKEEELTTLFYLLESQAKNK